MSDPPHLVLRDVIDSDLPIFFEHQRDPQAARMAAFPSRERDAFMAHWAKIRREPSNILRAIVFNGAVAGNIGSWLARASNDQLTRPLPPCQGGTEGGRTLHLNGTWSKERRLIGYWIGREFWGQGVATAALAAFIAEVKERPLHAFVAQQNVASIRVLEKCGFVPSPEHDSSIPSEDGVYEVLYTLAR